MASMKDLSCGEESRAAVAVAAGAAAPVAVRRAADEAVFHRRWPGFAATAALDGLRRREFSRLDAAGHVYLDFTGGGLYAAAQVRRHAERLLGGVFGNPHSSNPSSRAAGEAVEHDPPPRARLLPRRPR